MKPSRPTTRKLLTLSLVLLFGACPDQGTPVEPGVDLMNGTWVLRRSYFAAFIINIYLPPPGSLTLDTYSPAGAYTKVKDGELLMTARYIVTNDNSRIWLKYEDVQKANGFQFEQPEHMWVDVVGDTLFVNGYLGGDMTFGQVFARAR